MLINAISLKQNIISQIKEFKDQNPLILLSNQYQIKMIKNADIGYNIGKYLITYKNLKENSPRHLFTDKFLSNSKKKTQILDSELSLLLTKIIKELTIRFPQVKSSIYGLKIALNEWLYYGIDDNQLLYSDSEIFLYHVIKKIKQYCSNYNKELKGQGWIRLVQELANESILIDKPIIALLPVIYSPVIWKVLSLLSKYHQLQVIIQTNSNWLNQVDHDKEKFFLSTNKEQNNWQINITKYDYYLVRFFHFLRDNGVKYKINNFIDKIDKSNSKYSLSSLRKEKTIDKVKIISFSNSLSEALFIVKEICQIDQKKTIAIVSTDNNLLDLIYISLNKNNISSQNYIPSSLIDRAEGELLWLLLLYSLDKRKETMLAILKHPLSLTYQYIDDVWQYELSLHDHHSQSLPFISHLQNFIDQLQEISKEKCHSLIDWHNLFWSCYNKFISSDKCNDKTIDIIKNHIFFPLNNLHDNYQENISKSDYIAIIKDLLHKKEHYQQNENSHCKICLMSPLDSRSCNFDYLFFCGLDEKYYPLIPQDHGMIRDDTRKIYQYHRPSLYEIGYSEYDFLFLLASGGAITLSYHTEEPNRWLQLIKIYNNKKEEKQEKQQFDEIIKTTVSSAVPIGLRPKKISTRDITTLLNNPYEYYIEKILSLKKLNTTTDHHDSVKKFGFILHQVMARIDNYQCHYTTKDQYLDSLLSCYNSVSRKYIKEQKYLCDIWREKITAIGEWLYNNKHHLNKSVNQIEKKSELICKISEESQVIITTKIDKLQLQSVSKSTNDPYHKMFHIIDYKFGSLPLQSQIDRGEKPKIILEALSIAQKHNLIQNDENGRIEASFFHLNGLNNQVKKVRLNLRDQWFNLNNLLQKFYLNDIVYIATDQYSNSDYQHLARVMVNKKNHKY